MEIEAKIRLNNSPHLSPAAVTGRIKDLGGREKFRRFEVNVFYDTTQRKLKNKGEVLRLRSETYLDGTHTVSMTFKGRRKKGKMKTREEHEFQVTDFDQARSLLESLGYKETFRFEKRRTSFIMGECIVELDQLPYIGDFVEIEGANEKKIMKVAKALGIDDEKFITEGYGGLLVKNAIKHKRNKSVAEFATKSLL
jgi:adenylate cyclase class 2